MLSVASDANVQMNESKLAEKLEKEKSKRKYCEEKILELQKQLIQVEEKNHALKDNCSRKNLALRQVDQLLASNKHELDRYRATKMASINQLQGQLEQSTSALKVNQTELENEQRANALMSDKNDELNARIVELERQVLSLSDESETIRGELDEAKTETKSVKGQLAEMTDKMSNSQKLLETERGKVARMEKDDSQEKTRADKLQQSVDMMKLQLEQARVMRENHQKQHNVDRINWQKKLSELGDQIKAANDQIRVKNEQIDGMKRESSISSTNVETLQRELSTSKSEMDLLKARFTNEKDKLEVYFRSVQKSQKIEWEKQAEARLAETKATLEYRATELEVELGQVQQQARQDLLQLEKRLKEEYQAKIKTFLQQHFNHGLDALGITNQVRSSSPNISPIHSGRIEPRPPVQPRPQPHVASIATTEPNRRERELRKMISSLLSQTPQHQQQPQQPVQHQPQPNYLTSRLAELTKDTSLSDQDKRSLQKLRQLMTDNL